MGITSLKYELTISNLKSDTSIRQPNLEISTEPSRSIIILPIKEREPNSLNPKSINKSIPIINLLQSNSSGNSTSINAIKITITEFKCADSISKRD